jgi:hypothetical protein
MFESKELLKKVEYLETEREKLWKRILDLEKTVASNISQDEKEAKQAAKRAAEFRNRAEEKKVEIEDLYNLSKNTVDILKSELSESKELKASIQLQKDEALSSVEEIKSNSELLEEQTIKFQNFFTKYPNLADKLNLLETQLSSSQENSAKISAMFKVITERKQELDEIYFEIAGYEEEKENSDEVTNVEGLRDKLEKQYSNLEKGLRSLQLQFENLFTSTNSQTNEAINSWNDKYDSTIKKIESLLPKALTAGLSSAYSLKKEDEIKNYEKLKSQFNWGIFGLILISLISLFISIFFIRQGSTLLEVINILPKIATAVIPLYIPMLWFTFSANKKLNLSKRLIEEYTHKEVISKTFEGLSTQIQNLDDSDISNELKIKLLFNLMEMSTENPGKLISDYKNTDHPVLEVLNQQSKLEQALSKAKDFPGVSKLNDLVTKTKLQDLENKKEKLEKVVTDLREIIE